MRRVVVGALALLLLAAGLCGCLIERQGPARSVDRLDVVEERLGPDGTRCVGKGHLERRRGAVPARAREVARVQVTSKQPVPLDVVEETLAARAVQRCAQGFSVLRVAAVDGATGVVDVEAVLWVHGPAAPRNLASGDAGVSDAGEDW